MVEFFMRALFLGFYPVSSQGRNTEGASSVVSLIKVLIPS